MESTNMTSKRISVGRILTAVIEAMQADTLYFLQHLCTAASNSTETLVNQLLILAQEPDAQIVADRESWENIDAWVCEYTHIALLDDEDTYELYPVWSEQQVAGSSSGIHKWTMNLLYEQHIADKVYHGSDKLSDALREMIDADTLRTEMEEFYETYRMQTGRSPEYESNYYEREYGIYTDEDMPDLSPTKAEQEMEWLRQFIQNAVHFQLMLRCGLNPFDEYKAEDFQLRDEYVASREGFLLLLTKIHDKTAEYTDYLKNIAEQFPDQLPYSSARSVSPRRIAKELGVETGNDIWFPHAGVSFMGYDARRLAYLKNYAYHEYLAELMADSLADAVTAYGKNIRENAAQIRENKIAQRKAAGMTDEQIAAEKEMIDMEVREILRDEYFYC